MSEQGLEKIVFLINPRSGGHAGAEVIRRLKQYASGQQGLIEVEQLDADGSADQIARVRNAKIIVIGGGDGTVSTLLPKLAGGESKIGVLPLGTANDLARELGLLGQTPYENPAALVEFYRTAACREINLFSLEYGAGFSAKVSFINYVSFGSTLR